MESSHESSFAEVMSISSENTNMVTIETEPREGVATNSSKADAFRDKGATKPLDDDDYPRGLTLVVLAGVSIIAVFLIALDQVWLWRSFIFSSMVSANISIF